MGEGSRPLRTEIIDTRDQTAFFDLVAGSPRCWPNGLWHFGPLGFAQGLDKHNPRDFAPPDDHDQRRCVIDDHHDQRRCALLDHPCVAFNLPVQSADRSIEVYADCTTPSFEPTQIVLTCGDNGVIAEDLQWSSWTASEAVAVGTLSYNDCAPDCADGHRQQISGDQITLTDPVNGASGQLVWSMVQEDPMPPGYQSAPQALPTGDLNQS